MGYWLKLYTDILDDPKYFKLSKEARLGMYELLLVAKKIENGELTGQLPCVEDIAFYTRRSVEEWQKILPELVNIGMVSDDEIPVIKNYIKRQDAIPPDERMKQHRKKRNDSVMSDKTQMQRNYNGIETNRNGETDKKQIRKETEEDVEVEVDDNNPLILKFEECTYLETSPEDVKIANNLLKAGVSESDITTAIDFLMGSDNYKCTSFKSIIKTALLEMGKRKGKNKAEVNEDYRRYLKGEYGEFGSH